MIGLNVCVCLWICVLLDCVSGNHLSWGGQFGASSNAGSMSGSRASSGAGGASSSAWSSAGSGFRRAPAIFPSVGRRRSSQQRGANLGGQVFRLVPFRSQGRAQVSASRRASAPRFRTTTRRRSPVFSQARQNVLDMTRAGIFGSAPPGVQFIGSGGRSPSSLFNFLVPGNAQGISSSVPAGPPVSNAGGGLLFVDGVNMGGVSNYASLGASPHAPQLPPPGGKFSLSAAAVGAKIPNTSNKLTIQGQTATGDLLISGPGGTIAIGAEVLNGIARAGRGLMMTEFEEMELEGPPPMPGLRNNGSRGLKVTSNTGQSITLTGKETLMPPPGLHTGLGRHHAGLAPAPIAPPIVLGGLGPAAGSAATSSSSASSASSSATAHAGSVQVSASSSASANAVVLDSNLNKNNVTSVGGAVGGSGRGAATGSASAGTILVRSGSGKNERVLHLGQTDGKAQVITLGGAGQKGIKVGQGSMQVPGNATIVIGV